MGSFSGYPLTRWNGDRLMVLKEPFYFIDDDNKKWLVPTNAEINGATIPKFLWSVVGPPYVGPYRRASVVHDYFVGEGNNPDVTYVERRAADKMFYQACRTGGCSILQASKLYVGVSIGSWISKASSQRLKEVGAFDLVGEDKSVSMEEKYNNMMQKIEGSMVKGEDFSALEAMVNLELK